MTTEQMDWLDDERAGRHAADKLVPKGRPKVFRPDLRSEQPSIPWAELLTEARPWGMHDVPAVLYGEPTEEELYLANNGSGVLILPESMRPVPIADQEEHTHHTREARDQCAAGDHKYAVLLDDAAEREKVKTVSAEDYVTMAEEPIENRLRRAYENGLKQGLELGHQAFGNWDHH